LNRKIVIIGSAYPLRGGLAAYNERLAREFIAAGDKVSIETFSLQYPSVLFPGKTQYADWAAPADLKINVSINSINPLNWLKVGFRIRKQKPDIVIIKFWLPFMGPCFGTIARIIKGNRHSRIISILDNLIPHEHRPGDRILTRYFVKPVDGYIAMSDSVLNDANTFDPLKPRALCPHPLFDNFGAAISRDSALAKLGLSPDFRYLLFFGFIRDYKGLDLLLDAFADKDLETMPLKLIVAGEFYSDPKPYLEQIARLGIEENLVLRTDFIADQDVANYFCASDIVVQPYKSATQSGVTQIAYHFEKPMLVTNIGGLPEIVPHGKVGYVVEPRAIDIASALKDFFLHNRYSDFSANAHKEKEKYSWSKMVSTIYEVFGRINNKST
jgi:glycosyltransferase involved in cell wall biosynthesis